MKAEATREVVVPAFVPITLTITIESQVEKDALFKLFSFDCSVPEYLKENWSMPTVQARILSSAMSQIFNTLPRIKI